MNNNNKTAVVQHAAANINQEIDMKTIIIHGKMRQGKTVTAIHMSLDNRYNGRIYSNVDIYYNWTSILTKKITDFMELDRIRFSYTHWLMIIDEAGLNANSKDGFSETSRLLQKVLFLAGKKNCSVIWIAQRFESIDINARVLADIIVQVKKIRRRDNHPTFKLIRQRQRRTQLERMYEFKLDVIGEMKEMWITYNTLEESVLVNKIATSEKKKVKEKIQVEKRKRKQELAKKRKEKKLKSKKEKNE